MGRQVMRFPFDSQYTDYREVLDEFLALHGTLVTISRPAYNDSSGTRVAASSSTARFLLQSPFEGTQRDFQMAGHGNLKNEDGRDSLWFRYDVDVKEGDTITLDDFVYRVTLVKKHIHRGNGQDYVIALQVHRTREGQD